MLRVRVCCSIQLWNKRRLDFRLLITFKNSLYNSPLITSENMLPQAEFTRLRNAHDNAQIKEGIVGTEELVLAEIVDRETGLVDVHQFSELTDLFVYLPNKEKGVNHQASAEIHQILSSNSKTKAEFERQDASPEKVRIGKTLELVYSRINDRFKGFSAAFRFFDVNMNNKITFGEL